MKEDLMRLYNTLILIETKGESTKLMGECLKFTEGMINSMNESEAAQTKEA